MKKQLIIIGIIAILVTIELSGCTESEKQLLTPANIVLKNVTVNPSNPVEKENIYFTLTLENTGDNETPSITLGVYWTRRDGNVSRSLMNELFSIEGHSQKNYTFSIGTNNTVAGMQSFKIVYFDYNQSKEIILTIVNITIQLPSPEIYVCMTTGNVPALGFNIEKKTFNTSETVFVYIEYRNVNHNDIVDVNRSIAVYYQESRVVCYSNYNNDKQISKSDVWYAYWNFSTYNNSIGNWSSGKYQVDIGIHDRITGVKTTKTIYFTIL